MYLVSIIVEGVDACILCGLVCCICGCISPVGFANLFIIHCISVLRFVIFFCLNLKCALCVV